MPEPGYNPNAVSSYYNPNKSPVPKLRPSGLGSRPSSSSTSDRKGSSAVFSAPKPVYSSNDNNNNRSNNESDNRLTPVTALYSATASSLADAGARLAKNSEPRVSPMNLYDKKNMQEMKTELKDYLRGVAIEDGIAADMADMAVPEVYTGETDDVTVKAGDTLTAIAKDKGVSLQELIDANPQIANPDMIRPGEKVAMPSSKTVITPSTTTEATSTEIRTLTGMEKRYISDTLPPWQKSQGLPIYRRGRFHKPTLMKSIDKAGLTGEESSLLEGAIKSEVGNSGPTAERKYTYTGAVSQGGKAWEDRMTAEGLGSNATGEEIFNAVYANRLGNGDYASGDGNKYAGQGLLQITGRDNFQAVQDKLAETGLNIDIMSNPDLVSDEKYALPAALAMLDIMGINSSSASTMTAKTLNNAINSGANSTTAKARWANVIAAASTADKAELRLRNDYAAQEEVGLSGSAVDGDIGINTKAEIDTWAASKGLTVPAVTEITKIRQNGTSYQTFSPEDKLKLTIFVNENK
jgi:putative chitinase